MDVTARGLEPRTSADTAEVAELADASRTLAKLEATGSANFITRVLANSPNGFRPYVLMSNGLLNKAALPATVREVVILALAQRRGTRYEWWEHEDMSDAAGVSDAQRAAIARGRLDDASLFSEEERFAMAVGLQLGQGHGIDDDDWGTARRWWGDAGALDLVLTVGWWGGFVPTVIEALRLDDLVPELAGRE